MPNVTLTAIVQANNDYLWNIGEDYGRTCEEEPLDHSRDWFHAFGHRRHRRFLTSNELATMSHLRARQLLPVRASERQGEKLSAAELSALSQIFLQYMRAADLDRPKQQTREFVDKVTG